MNKNIMYDYSKEDHRKRLLNIKEVERSMSGCRKKELLMDYEPGHYIYHASKAGTPEEDSELFQTLAKAGAKYIYLWSGWAAKENKWDGEAMYMPQDPEGLRNFLDQAHSYGLKVLPYTSTNFFNRNSPLFDPDWAYDAANDLHLTGLGLDLAHCSPNSPGWRGHLTGQHVNLLDTFDFDGLYIDSGYFRRCDLIGGLGYYEEEPVMVKDEILAFEESATHDGGMEDLLLMLYAEVKRRGKTLTVFKEGTDCFRTEYKIYDYMLAGECATDIDFVRRRIRDYDHVLLDFSLNRPMKQEEYYLNTLPFLHFPLLKKNSITMSDPNMVVPDFEQALGWLSLFKEMTIDGTWCYMDVDCPELIQNKSAETVCTMYVNAESYVVLANFGKTDNEIGLADEYVEVRPGQEVKPVSKSIVVKSRSIRILKKV